MVTPLRIVLLGATGFVGSAILRRLRQRQERWGTSSVEIRALVRHDPQRLAAPGITAVHGELPTIPTSLFFEDPHVVVHFAMKQIDADGSGFHAVNVQGAERLAESLPPSCRGVVHGSSVSVYGQGAQEGLSEDAPLGPETALADSRLRAETCLRLAALQRGIGARIFRPRFILGQGDRFTLPGLVALTRRRIRIGSGQQAFTVIDVDDYAELVVRACERLASGKDGVSVLHAGYERPLGFDEITGMLRQRLALPPPRLRIPANPSFFRVLRWLPGSMAEGLATRLELVGLPHYFDVSRLKNELAPDLATRDPAAVLSRAIDHLRPQRD